MGYQVQDASLINETALPAAASTTVHGASFDLENGPMGDVVADFQFNVALPVLNATELPNTDTLTVDIEHSLDNVTFTTLIPQVLIATGAGGVGSAAAVFATRLPVDINRYVRASATTSAGTATMAASNMTCWLTF
jgi:hypothetical protein